MRRDLSAEIPQLTKFYGLRPWELERLTWRELSEYRAQMKAYLERDE